ncbi:angiotensinogen [Xiphias gladius]|uniref:angiotensinogen n=1 Tax=Xiphias gladius TaxID=8245 RepID=UPI001A9894D7|nr:angiotensinogen [Xiphias gladius]XP_039994531.1 angiotensinogen [Xiphias gladius]XP_039994532.1 angiotensinogen [Xiphias gladius]XP_039994533.1 angiotensinogen [Xiphias gladius]
MQRSPLLFLLLCCWLSEIQANRVYVHPFHLFAAENVSCETLQDQTSKPLETLPVAPLDIEVLTPDSRDQSKLDAQRQNITERTAVLAELLNSLGLRMYQALSKQHSTNTLLSPVNTFGSLVTFYLGASKKTARTFQLLLGLISETDREDCVSLVDGHKVLKTLQSFNSLEDDGPKDEIATQVWAFTRQDVQLSEDFIQGTQDFSDTLFIRSVDFSKPQEAEQLVNNFVERTSDGKVKSIFKDLNSSSNLLFITSFNFQGSWRTAFQPEKTSLQEFHVDDTTTVMAPLMTHTGQYHYLNDKVRQCTVVKLSLSKQSYMLLVLPHEGANVRDIESKLRTDLMSNWHQSLQEGLLELSLPKFSMSSVTDVRDLLTNMDLEIEAKLLGSQAEFSQLSNTKPFSIDKAVNIVLFEMSEEGAEPQDNIQEAGVPLKLSINRPFFFSVIKEYSNVILMLGKITNPTL